MHSALSAGWRRYNHELIIIPTWDPVKSSYRGCQSQQLLCTLEFLFPNQVLRVSYYHLYMRHCGIVGEEPGPSIRTIFTFDFSLLTSPGFYFARLFGPQAIVQAQLFELPHGNLGKPWGPKGIPKIVFFIQGCTWKSYFLLQGVEVAEHHEFQISCQGNDIYI